MGAMSEETASPGDAEAAVSEGVAAERRDPQPTTVQRAWLVRGLAQPGGKLPLFDRDGQRVSTRTVRSCLDHGWAEPWFANPLKPDWLVCKLTPAGRRLAEDPRAPVAGTARANVVRLAIAPAHPAGHRKQR
jgi:hypothetical protein